MVSSRSRPLSGNLFSLPPRTKRPFACQLRSRPLSGNLFSLPYFKIQARLWCRKVLVPYRGIYFLYFLRKVYGYTASSGSRPLSGNLFSLLGVPMRMKKKMVQFSSPIGESIFSTWVISGLLSYRQVLVPYRGIYFLYPASGTPLFIRVPKLFCGAKFKICFSFTFSYACSAFFLILSHAAQNLLYCLENSILPIPISYNFP